jgi:antirestriction protein ArdC
MATKTKKRRTSKTARKPKARKSSPKPKRDLYQEITDRIVEAIEKGSVMPWQKPWSSPYAPGMYGEKLNPAMPYNGVSKKNYRGINVMLLWLSGHTDSRWYSYNQAVQKAGYTRDADTGRWIWARDEPEPEQWPIPKGTKGSMVTFFKNIYIGQKDSDGNVIKNADGSDKKKRIPLLKCFTAFNHEQVAWPKGREPKLPVAKVEEKTDDAAPAEPVIEYQLAKETVDSTGAIITHGGDRACYSPTLDSIRLPEVSTFSDEGSYWATSLHEIAHWTGHESRLSRDLTGRFGSDSYAVEELVAEIASAFLCARTSVEGKLQHTEYVANWLKVLKGDKYAIFTASREAEKAAEFVLNGGEAVTTDDIEQTPDEAAEAA